MILGDRPSPCSASHVPRGQRCLRAAHSHSARRRVRHRATLRVACGSWWGVDSVVQQLRRKRLDPKTVERIYEADVYPAVFDFAAWNAHRSRRRYLEHIVTLFRSYFFRDLLGPLSWLIGMAVTVGLYETAIEDGLLPGWLPSLMGVSDTPFQLTSFALSLMLVFRTNSSYARWLDARQQWGTIVNTARTFVRQALTSLPEDSCSDLRCAVQRWTIAFVRLSKLHLREVGDVRQELQGLLLPEELPLMLTSGHRPLTACHVLSEVLRTAEANGQLHPLARTRLEADINTLSLSLGACEKILRNPIPLSYTRHTARFLILWLVWLPVALWGKASWGVVPVEGVLAYLLLGIDEIAIQMEEPFGILPLESLCDAVQASIDTLGSTDHAVAAIVAGYACAVPAGGRGQAPDQPNAPPTAGGASTNGQQATNGQVRGEVEAGATSAAYASVAGTGAAAVGASSGSTGAAAAAATAMAVGRPPGGPTPPLNPAPTPAPPAGPLGQAPWLALGTGPPGGAAAAPSVGRGKPPPAAAVAVLGAWDESARTRSIDLTE